MPAPNVLKTEAAVLAAECIALEARVLSLLQDVETHRELLLRVLSILGVVAIERDEAFRALRAHRRADADRQRREWARFGGD